MAKRRRKLSDQVRRAVESSGLSRYAICKALGLAQATMSRFMSGQGGLSMDYLDALADLLDLNVTTGDTKPAEKGRNSGKHQQ
jgi:transcriptional regulator with XRE-family HTH domain